MCMNENLHEPVGSASMPDQTQTACPAPIPCNAHIPAEKRERFNEVALMLERFGQSHLDPELTGFTLELWRRLCRRQTIDCRADGLTFGPLPLSTLSPE